MVRNNFIIYVVVVLLTSYFGPTFERAKGMIPKVDVKVSELCRKFARF